MRRRLARVLAPAALVLALLLALRSVSHEQRAEATFSGVNGRLAYTLSNEIYVSDADGGNAVNVTSNNDSDFEPAWSPDGTMIAFTSERDGNREIYVMNDDGTDQTNLTNDSSSDFQPTWSPDGSTILYRRSGELYTVSPAGGGPQSLGIQGSGPDYRPDGAKITFSDNADGDYEIYSADADGDNAQQLTFNTVPDFSPSYSPDGTKIAFERESADGNDGDIYVISASNGSGEVHLTDEPDDFDGEVAWSPDGTMISFSRSGELGNEGTFVVPPDRSAEPQFLVQNGFSLSWSVSALTLLQGDVNCDGVVTGADGSALIADAAELDFPHEPGCPSIGATVASFFGDVDCYGTVDLIDALQIFRYLAGMTPNQNELCPAIGTPLQPAP